MRNLRFYYDFSLRWYRLYKIKSLEYLNQPYRYQKNQPFSTFDQRKFIFVEKILTSIFLDKIYHLNTQNAMNESWFNSYFEFHDGAKCWHIDFIWIIMMFMIVEKSIFYHEWNYSDDFFKVHLNVWFSVTVCVSLRE